MTHPKRALSLMAAMMAATPALAQPAANVPSPSPHSVAVEAGSGRVLELTDQSELRHLLHARRERVEQAARLLRRFLLAGRDRDHRGEVAQEQAVVAVDHDPEQLAGPAEDQIAARGREAGRYG